MARQAALELALALNPSRFAGFSSADIRPAIDFLYPYANVVSRDLNSFKVGLTVDYVLFLLPREPFLTPTSLSPPADQLHPSAAAPQRIA